MMIIQFATLTVVGFVACAEFGSYAFVHPVIKRLPPQEHITVEQGLLRTFGRFMPIGMTAAPVLAATYAADVRTIPAWIAVAALTLALLTTIAVNVRINLRTHTWDPAQPPADWKHTRDQWELFQAIRSWWLLAGFILVCLAASR
jgi:hypothetical protein